MTDVKHISGGTVENRMSHDEMYSCAARCFRAGDPPCYKLPELTSDWPEGKPIVACSECATPNTEGKE